LDTCHSGDGFVKKLLFVLALIGSVSCEPISIDPNNPDNQPADPIGTLIANFPVEHAWLPTSGIIRTDLHISLNANDLSRGIYIQSANPTNSQSRYNFYLPPGNYYLEAGIACLCGGDSCSAAGFAGNKWGQKHASYTFAIAEDKTTELTIQFLQ
jgi:hypothetical protein